ncbi:uncharacterized protein N7473_005272, partial [Penicillium subrubescens]|uniref:uncharacterized protein n=1 Tax=Penicillium subrubescens TaxID=1316194 RepID=UPI0025459A77
PGGLHQWGRVGLFSRMLGLVPNYNHTDKSIAVVAWELTELMGHVVCVVDPCSATPWFLRIVLMPDFLFLGLHWAGTDVPVSSLGTYYHFLVAAISQRPLATGAMACYPLPFNTEWLNLFCALEAHLGGKAGDIDHLPPSMSSIPAAAAAAAANVPDATAVSSFAPAVAALDVDMEEVEEETGVVGGVMGSGSGVAGGSAGGSVGGSVGGGALPQLSPGTAG